MNIVRISHRSLMRLAVAGLMTVASGACGLDKQSAPDLIGPSEFALSLTLSASPNVLAQDGRSQTVITAVARDERGRAVPNVTILWGGTASTSRLLPIRLSALSSVTDANGVAAVVLSSPPEPATESTNPPATITVTATPVSSVDHFTSPRLITVELRPVTSTGQTPPFRNNAPIPAVTVSNAAPLVGETITFNATQSTDEGEICLDRCTYLWNFGDGRVASGRIVSHSYGSGGTYTATLTVTDERASSASTTVSVTVSGTSAPVATFTFSPSEPVAGSPVTFDARSSTTSNSAVIVTYEWNFGDGTVITTGTPTTDHTYTDGRNPYHVTLTVTDSNDATATTARDIVVRD
jgi:hypothetical protein